MPIDVDWIILGDFNLIRKPEDRNKPGGIWQKYSGLILQSAQWG
jgi:hypothetical protein